MRVSTRVLLVASMVGLAGPAGCADKTVPSTSDLGGGTDLGGGGDLGADGDVSPSDLGPPDGALPTDAGPPADLGPGVVITEDGGFTWTCRRMACGSHLTECGDCEDNDGDGLFDERDPECLGPCDNSEGSALTAGVGALVGAAL